DVINLEGDGEGDDPPDPGDPQEALDGRGVQELPLDRPLEGVDLLGEEGDLPLLELRLELVQWRQLLHRRDVELLQQGVQTILTAAAALHQPEPSSQDIPGPPLG